MIPAKQSRLWRACRVFQSSFRRVRAEGRNDASKRSASLRIASRLRRPSSDLRSSTRTLCPAHNSLYQCAANFCSGSPVGGSIFMTVAPMRTKREAAIGAGALSPVFTIFRPCSRIVLVSCEKSKRDWTPLNLTATYHNLYLFLTAIKQPFLTQSLQVKKYKQYLASSLYSASCVCADFGCIFH